MSQSPFHSTNDRTRDFARKMIAHMKTAVLSAVDQTSAYPYITRISAQADSDGTPLAFLREIAPTTRLLDNNPRGALLIEAAPGGSVMAHARMMLQVVGRRLPNNSQQHAERARSWVERDPRARSFISMPDFYFWRLEPQGGVLMVNYGQLYHLRPSDLKTPPAPQDQGQKAG